MTTDVDSREPIAFYNMPHKVGYPSVIGEVDIKEWTEKYYFPADVILQVIGLKDRAYNFRVEEVMVY